MANAPEKSDGQAAPDPVAPVQPAPAPSEPPRPAAPAKRARAPRPARPHQPDARTVLFEVAWEVVNQVGGIYTVLRSKAPLMSEKWGARYTLVGPYEPAKAALEFEPSKPPRWLAGALDALEHEGLKIHHGRWLISSKPRALLIEHGRPMHELNLIKYGLWEQLGIDFPPSDWMIDGVATFGHAVARLLEKVCPGPSAAPGVPKDLRVVAHFHEWQGGLAIPILRRKNLPVATAFTTHATLLGRYIAGSEDNFYDNLSRRDGFREAERFNIRAPHAIERACAHGAHVFTTVSSITGEECVSLLGRKPDVITPNALNINRYNVGHDFQTFHAQYKEGIHRFVMGHFFPSYPFDLDKTMYFFTSGRFEPRNKGFDLCLEAMARLNAELKASRLGMNVVFFIVSSRPVRSISPLAMQSRGVLNELRDVCRQITDQLGEQLFRRGAAGQRVNLDDLVDEYWRLRYRRTQQALKTGRLPVVVTHILEQENDDPVLQQIRALNLFNKPEDPVKIVYHPEFISPVNPLWGMEYEQFVRGCHLGVFPSAYEPWGYTPLECVAMGVPAVTSDLAGFGRYVAETYPDHDSWGLTVLRRRGRSFQQSAAELARVLLAFCRMDRRQRIALRNEVERRSWNFDWARMGPAYHRAHELALERAGAARTA